MPRLLRWLGWTLAGLVLLSVFAAGGGYLWLRQSLPKPELAPGDAPARRFIPLLLGTAVSETLNAWLFGRAGSPQTGQYFANDDAAFQWINRITWLEICVLLPGLVWWLARYHSERRTP